LSLCEDDINDNYRRFIIFDDDDDDDNNGKDYDRDGDVKKRL
jgi:hypothetical protein